MAFIFLVICLAMLFTPVKVASADSKPAPVAGSGNVSVVDMGEGKYRIGGVKEDIVAWENYEKSSEPYKRIRIAYIDAARKRPIEFKKRLESFIKKTRDGKLIVGFGGIDKYYG